MKKLTLKQMASELNKFFKENRHDCQYSIRERTILYIDYSIVTHRKEYGIAPIYVEKRKSEDLREDYRLMKKGLIS